MTKFSLKAAVAAAQENKSSQPIPAGYHRVVITQVAEIGLQAHYHREGEPRESLGIVFMNAKGRTLLKTMTLAITSNSHLARILSVIDNELDELKDLIGQQLILEIEANGNWPKVIGYYHVDEGLSHEPALDMPSDTFYYSVETPDPEILKKLHPQLKQAISGRIRPKGG